MIRIDEIKGGRRRGEVLARFDRWHARYDAAEWRFDHRVIELPLRFIDLRLRLLVRRKLLYRDVRIAVEPGELDLCLLLQRLNLALVGFERETCLVVVLLRDGIAAHERCV